MSLMSEQGSFGQQHFGKAMLGDRRRTERLVAIADRLVKHPSGSLPNKLGDPMALKALYRLMEADEVTHESVLAPHRQHTREVMAQQPPEQVVLILHDTTELDFTTNFSLEGLGQIGKGNRSGLLCHNSLAILAYSRQVIGLTNQILHARPPKDEEEPERSIAERRSDPERESRLWLEGVQGSGTVTGPQVVDICDRGGDTFEFLEYEVLHGRSFVVRSTHSRALVGREEGLHPYAQRQPSLGERIVTVADSFARSKREAVVAVSAAAVTIKAPSQRRGEHGTQPLPMWVVRVWEVDPPPSARSEEPLEWLLLTNVPIASFEDACRIVDWYACRPLIEEYHKAQKTGCHIEQMQFQYLDRLQPAIALLSVTALTLLALRDASRRPDAKTRRATDLLHRDYVETLSLWRYREVRLEMTIHDFYYALARLGGHQNRKRDGAPGWLVLWRGWEKLHLLDLGADTVRLRKRCG